MSAGTVAEGATLSLKNLLVSTDANQLADALVYTVKTLPEQGTLTLGGVALTAGGTFTQKDVNDDKLSYVHGGGEAATDEFAWELNDANGKLASKFAIAITPVNDAPVVVMNPLSSVAEGATLVLDSNKLLVMDSDSQTLTYTLVSVPTRGKLEKRASATAAFAALAANDVFTQADIANGNVRFVDSGVDDTRLAAQQDSSTQFSWRVSDGDGGFNPSPAGSNVTTFTVTSVDDPPVVSWRATGCYRALQAGTADPLASISDADDPVSQYSICIVSIGGADGGRVVATTGGGFTVVVNSVTDVPTLKLGGTPIAAPACVAVGSRNTLTLINDIDAGGGSVTWMLRRNRDAKDFGPAQTMTFSNPQPPCP